MIQAIIDKIKALALKAKQETFPQTRPGIVKPPKANPVKLMIPDDYVGLTREQIKEVSNGCGSSQARFDFIPDTMYGLDISLACDYHDLMYRDGKTERDKEVADAFFLVNMLHLINRRGGPLRHFRRLRALSYYSGVFECGGDAFWDKKVRPQVLQAHIEAPPRNPELAYYASEEIEAAYREDR